MIRRIVRELARSLGRWTLVLATVAIVGALLIATFSAASLFVAHQALEAAPSLPEPEVDVSEIPDLQQAVQRSASRASVLLDRNGDVIGRFKPEETHIPFAVGDVPDIVERVLTASEDEDFRDHAGFDPRAIARAFARNASRGEIEQGGSTITQQLAKLLFTGSDNSLDRKLQELQVAIDLEERFSKDEILTAYVNTVFLGEGAYGFEAAAREYFRKPAAEMTLGEAALLVGVLPAPTTRNIRRHPRAALEAWQTVLRRVEATGAATPEEVAEALARPPEVHPPQPIVEGFPYFVDYVRRFLLDEQRFDPELLYEGGLVIETALDPELQAAASYAVAAHVPDEVAPEAALAVVEVGTGLVPAIVGGRNFGGAQVNLALGREGGGTGRQAGSSFKPFVLATALEMGISPAQPISAPQEFLPTTVDDPKPVHNFSGRGHGVLPLTEATIGSVNTAYVQLTEIVGARAVRDTATRLGVEHLPESVGPSIGIGAYETSPLAMARAYAGFAHDGLRVPSSPVRRILGPDGAVVADFTPPPATEWPRAISVDTARRVNRILEQNVQRGTATRGQIGRPAAAKTGTANDYTNAWLVGHTPVYATAVWVGFPDANVPMYDIAGFSRVTGGSIPALIWRDVMAAAHDGVPPVPFPPAPPDPPPTAEVLQVGPLPPGGLIATGRG
jgi:penicillin-binding protein 1A